MDFPLSSRTKNGMVAWAERKSLRLNRETLEFSCCMEEDGVGVGWGTGAETGLDCPILHLLLVLQTHCG